MVSTGIRMSNIGEYIKVFMIDVENETMGTIEMPNTLKDMKKLVGAPTIQVGTIAIGEYTFKAIYTARANDKMHISCADEKGVSVYRGNVLIVGFETDVNKGEILCSLSDEEAQLLLANTGLMYIECKDNTAYNTYVLCNVKVIDDDEENKE